MRYDALFVGAGLANLVAAYRLKLARPDVRLLLVDQKTKLGGGHTWSFHEGDLCATSKSWFLPLASKVWEGYDVRFPELKRRLLNRYYSIDSAEFVSKLCWDGVDLALAETVISVAAHEVTSEKNRWEAECVFDGRGWRPGAVACAYQKFVGQRVLFENPHGIERPVIMDATVSQLDGYRFVYLLPWSNRELLVEDTRYSDNPGVDSLKFREEIRQYCIAQGFLSEREVPQVIYEEVGVLPIPLSGNLEFADDGVIPWGTRAGFFQPTTGYSLPVAVANAEKLVELGSLSHSRIYSELRKLQQVHWRSGRFLRGLNRMMFYAALPQERYRILQRFYGLSEDLIERFYAGNLTVADQARILSGKPPVSITKALKALWLDPNWKEAHGV